MMKNTHKPYGIYEKFFKRPLDFLIAFAVLIVISPVLLILTVVGAVVMGGNPFFTQERPGKNEKIFKLIKFRSMTNKKDEFGKLLPDKERLTPYGRLLRSTSLDELPELLNILKGDMAIVGPRPLAVLYLPYYTQSERHRHDVRPGLTGLAQVNGRNAISFEEKFVYDIQYASKITLIGDIKIIFKTVKKVFIHEGIGQGEQMPVSLHIEREDWILTEQGAERPEVKI